MQNFIDLKPGGIVHQNDRKFIIKGIIDFKNILVQCDESGEIREIRLDTLDEFDIEKIYYGEKNKCLERISAKAWEIAENRYAIIEPLLNKRRTKAEVIVRAKNSDVHASTIYRWIYDYESTLRLSALLPSPGIGGKGRKRLRKETESIIQAAINELYLTKQRPSIHKTIKEIKYRCWAANIPPPHPNTIRNRISKLSNEFKIKRRIGSKAARNEYSPQTGHYEDAKFPLSIVQIDHALVDLELVDEIERLPIGKPWITLAIDIYSRMIAGYYISLDPPGALAAGLCIAHSILPKEKWLKKYGIKTSWPVWGLMGTIHMDNARDFRGKMIHRACVDYGINPIFRPVKTPEYGGHIERLCRTLNTFIHDLPGTTFSNIQEKGNYDSEKSSIFTIFELEELLVTYITETYHEEFHDEILMKPKQKYEEGILGTKGKPGIGLPKIPIDEKRIHFDFMPYVERTIQQNGVRIDNVHYYHDILRKYINARDPEDNSKKRLFIFKRDPRDISIIYFYDPELNDYFPVPFRDTSKPPISLWEFRAILKNLIEKGRRGVDEDLIFESYRKVKEIEKRAKRLTKKQRRANQRILINQSTDKRGISHSQEENEFKNTEIEIENTEIKPFDDYELLD